ncbi:Sec-independent protein translocase TatC [Legionella lansingensis]|uniref:Sec-independent protein translocase protein TatC n=1 Tax=Legionella lansingensis TaxID=45067 RepID=A0A0W0VEX8_9GAMM|nr:twin-arginine translocase subunit TatC [Legionella lansingensis]KTD18686.1 Sec-independent protein translocase TatC [Legionella lansingensis]SNV57305.1 Sec-independent protein translocase TatC [Legionella lansingensis]
MLNYLLELRRRALWVIFFFFVFFLLFFYFANDLFTALVTPLLGALSAKDSLIATQITSPVFTPIKLAADTALLCTAPFALLQIWQFIAPGLYRHERYNLRAAITMSVVLFFLGMLFCFYIVLPFMFHFFAKAVPLGVRLLPDMTYALDFITRMLLLFGLCFQVPLVCVTLVRLGWVELALLRKVRPYIIVAAFTIGMLLTPPDVFSQIMLAVPLCLLYELGLFLAAMKTYRSET